MSGNAGWTRSRALVVSAVGYQWFYNGANFVAFKIGGAAVHPVLLATLRFGLAAVVVLPLALWRWRSRPARLVELAAAAGLGVVMLVGGQALGMLGTHLLSAGVASVFASAAPIFLAVFAWSILRKPLEPGHVLGVGLGFAGLALMAWVSSAGGGFSVVNADVSPTVANSFAYAAPVVALLLSAAMLGEPLLLPKLLAAGVALSGVALMMRGSRDRR